MYALTRIFSICSRTGIENIFYSTKLNANKIYRVSILIYYPKIIKLEKMVSINPNKVLPPNMAIDSIDNILYSIGLCHHSVRKGAKRLTLHSPKLILFIVIINVVTQTISIFTDDEFTHLLLYDLGHGIGITFYSSIMMIILSLIALFSQSVYYWNHKRGIEPTFVRVFQVISGSITPSSVGLTNERQVRQLLMIGKWLKPIQRITKIAQPILVFTYVLTNYFSSNSKITVIILSPYLFISITTWAYFVQTLLSIQILLFCIICKYFIIKLKELNEIMRKMKIINSNKIKNILNSFDFIYREIDEYNTTYWSKFLCNIWFFFGVFIVVLIFLTFFSNAPSLYKILIFYYVIFFTSLYLFIMSITSSLNSEANKSYKIFNTFYVKYCKLMPRRKLLVCLKVC